MTYSPKACYAQREKPVRPIEVEVNSRGRKSWRSSLVHHSHLKLRGSRSMRWGLTQIRMLSKLLRKKKPRNWVLILMGKSEHYDWWGPLLIWVRTWESYHQKDIDWTWEHSHWVGMIANNLTFISLWLAQIYELRHIRIKIDYFCHIDHQSKGRVRRE